MNTLSIDIETRSSADLAKCGVYRYCEAPDFAILLFAWSADGGPVQVADLACGETIPPDVLAALTDPGCTKWAFNAMFERVCLSRYLGLPAGEYLAPEAWRCSMIWSAYLGLPLSLQGVGEVLGLEKQKLETGKDLIQIFCRPALTGSNGIAGCILPENSGDLSCIPSESIGGSSRIPPERSENHGPVPPENRGGVRYIRPQDRPEQWEQFKEYNLRDVETEAGIQKRLANHPVPDSVWEEYHRDQRINDTGVLLDRELVTQALRMDECTHRALAEEFHRRTGMDNPNSAAQLRQWLAGHGIETDSVDKKAVAELMKTAPQEIREVLSLRQRLARSSVRKYQAMENAACADGRARGCFQFYGANRTGRWSGRLIQLQNLPQNHIEDLEAARALVRAGDREAVEARYGDVPDILSQLIRTAFVARPGTRFLVADYAAIEARITAYLAEEEWRLEAFRAGKDIYCASASAMFGVPVEKHGVNGHLRQKGKIAELALGYGGGAGALTAMGALDMGLRESELPDLVAAWRAANPAIVSFWWDVDRAAKDAVAGKMTTETHGIPFAYRSGMLFLTLPSGRQLAYVKPRFGINKYGGDCITYEGLNSAKKWDRLETYGPKLVENIVQATARDVLAHAMLQLKDARIVMHIHDELVIEAPEGLTLEQVCHAMERTPPWLPDLPLHADGYETEFYRKE